MTNQILTPTPFVKDGAGLNVSALMTTPTQVTLQFANSGREVLLVSGTGAQTVTVDIGTTILGQTVSNFPAVTLTPTGNIFAFGPFDAPVDQAGTANVLVTLSATAGVLVALVQNAGAY